MGCDIHGFLEVSHFEGAACAALFAGEAYLPRDYAVFDALAGVRGNRDRPPLFAPRGLPLDISEAAFENFFSFVIDEADVSLWRGYNWVTIDEVSTTDRFPMEIKPSGMRSKHGYVPNPDWHTPSYLLIDEIHAALAHAGITEGQLAPEWRFTIDTLSNAQRQLAKRARLVFWFDN